MADSIVSRVKRGAELLDEKLPDWYQRIKTRDLRMELGDRCILGQSFREAVSPAFSNGYYAGLKELGITLGDDHRFGFSAEKEEHWDKLSRYWLKAVGRRRVAEGKRLIRDGRKLTG